MRKIILSIIVFACSEKNNINAQNWVPLGTGLGLVPYYDEGWVTSSAVYNGELYVGGVFDSAGGIAVNRIAKWNGANWSDVGGGMKFNGGSNCHVRTMIVYNGELYAGGVFDSAGGIAAKNIAKWNGTNWSAVSPEANNVIIDLIVYNSELYAAGAFDSIGGIAANRIAKWNGTNWSALGAGIDLDWYVDHPTSVTSLTVNNGELYVGGAFDTAGTGPANSIAKWNGTNWSAVGSGVTYGTVYSLAVYNVAVYVGGDFWIGGNVLANDIAKWNGSNWSSVGTGTDFAPAALAVYNGILYAGGFYPNYIDGPTDGDGEYYSLNYIAKWNGTYWSVLGQGVNRPVFELLATDSALYVGGSFTQAGNIPANGIVKWLGQCSDPLQPGPIIGNDTICEGSTQTYYIDTVPGALSYVWTVPYEWLGYSSTNSISITAGYSSTLSVTAYNDCGNSPSQTLLITTIPSSASEYIYGNNSVCPGSTQTYFIDPVPDAISYSWTLPPGWSGNSTTESITVIAGSNPGIISVSATHNSCGSGIAQTLEVAVNSAPLQPGLITGDDHVCQGTPETYSVNPVTGATSYTWNLPAGWSGISDSNSITVQVGLNGGIISVTANNSCGVSNAQTLTIALGQIAPDNPGTINGDSVVCENTLHTYSIEPVQGATSYIWTLPSGWTGSSTTNTIATAAGSNGGVISVIASNNCGNGNIQTLSVTTLLKPEPPGPISGTNDICSGNTETYFISPVTGANYYTWNLPTGWSGYSNSNSILILAGLNSGILSVVASNNCGTTLSQTMMITANSVPTMPAFINGNGTVCEGSSQTYFIDPVPGATGYAWDLTFGGSGSSNTDSITIVVDQHGYLDDLISVSAYNNCGSSNLQILPVIVNLLPEYPNGIIGNTAVCRGSVQTYFTNPVYNTTSYTWTLPPGWIGSSNTSSINVTAGNDPGEISVIANNSCGSGAFTSLPIRIDTIPSKPNDITGNVFVNAGQTHSYSINLINGVSGYNWLVSGRGNIITGQNTSKVDVNWQTPGTYILSVNAANNCGISADQKLAIKVSAANMEDPYSLQLFPNPSSGQFFLKAKRVQDKVINVEVLNMAGQLVFRSGKKQGANDYTQSINLDKMAAGIYAVKIMIDDKVLVRSVMIKH